MGCDDRPVRVTRPSRPWLKARVDDTADLTTATVQFGLTAGAGVPTSWTLGEWVAGARNLARFLFDSTSTAPGRYTVWVQIVDSPEQLVLPAGVLIVV
jgi:hypothetical protein